MAPEGLSFPLIVQAGCRNESCMGGTWAACDRIPVVQAPLEPDRVIAWLTRNERFEVVGANRVVRTPGVIRMIRDSRQGTSGEEVLLRAGDTVYVLDYRSEGGFNIWHDGGIFQVYVFWPWKAQPGATGHPAEVLREAESEFWLRVETGSGVRGWVERGSGRILDLLGLFHSGGGPTPCDASE
jgi:hypothetical protein